MSGIFNFGNNKDAEVAIEKPSKDPWYRARKHPVIYVLFALNLVELVIWFACICSSQWAVGPFDNFMKDSTVFWESQVFYGVWRYCVVRYSYDPYTAWEEQPVAINLRFTAKTSCSISALFATRDKLIEYSVAFALGVILGAVVSSALFISWVIFDKYSALIKRLLLPMVKVVQSGCTMIMMACLALKTLQATRLWCWYAACTMLFLQWFVILIHVLIVFCQSRVEGLEYVLCTKYRWGGIWPRDSEDLKW